MGGEVSPRSVELTNKTRTEEENDLTGKKPGSPIVQAARRANEIRIRYAYLFPIGESPDDERVGREGP